MKLSIRSMLFALIMLAMPAASFAQIGVGISVTIAPPELPVYEQPICPGEGYIWTPGYWAWDGDDYCWVPGHMGHCSTTLSHMSCFVTRQLSNVLLSACPPARCQ
jgi:hypothetical protein